MSIIDSIQLSGTTYQIQVTVDAALDSGSTNPVANSAITTALDDKVNVVDNEVPDYNVTSQITYQGGYPSQTETASTWDAASMFTLKYNFLKLSDTNYTTTAAVIDPSGNITTGNVTTDEYRIGNPLPDYIDMVREDEEFSAKCYFTAKEGYRIAHLDIYSSRYGSYGNIIEERVETVFEGGQSADVIKDVIEPTLINKQDQLVSGTNIKTINNTSILGSGNIDIQGGGKAIEAGRGIAITTGETADTVSFSLPISAGTGTNSIAEGYQTQANGNQSHAEGQNTSATTYASHAEGRNTTASGSYSHAEGRYTTASGLSSHAEGSYTTANNQSEHASGQHNVSNSASTTFGDSGNTLFSVGNGTANNARHNAFEIRQNGDIYLSSGGTDIKLQDHLGGSSITVDSTLSPTSENPVQNKVIYNKIDEVEQVTAAGLNALNSKITPTVELTQAEYDALTTKDPNTYYIITDAQAGDLTNYYTKSETNTLLGGKQATLVSAVNIKTINNESILGSGNIDIQGGSTYTAGRGIDITNDTVSLDLPIYKTVSGTAHSLVLNTSSEPSANTFKAKYNTYINCTSPYVDNNSSTKNLIMGEACSAMSYAADSFVGGYSSKIGDMRTFAFGGRSEALAAGAVAFGYDAQHFKPQVSKGQGSFACGGGTSANTQYSFATGYHTFTTRRSEFASGQYNNSVSATTTFGDSGNTLFSVGNGTADNARHNAFEIRQNGDIYLTKDGQDVKLQDQLGGSSITVDSALSSTSENPVQNKVIYNKIDEVEQVTAAALNNINDRLSEDEEVTAAGLNALNDNFGGLKLVKLTEAEYNALATKDASTLYIIVD